MVSDSPNPCMRASSTDSFDKYSVPGSGNTSVNKTKAVLQSRGWGHNTQVTSGNGQNYGKRIRRGLGKGLSEGPFKQKAS